MTISSWPLFAPTTTASKPLTVLTADTSPVFSAAGQPWRWRGVSAFPLCARFARFDDIQPFLDAFAGYNLLRVWDYVPWPGTGWESSPPVVWRRFLDYVGARGFYVELTLLTDDDPARIRPAQDLVTALSDDPPTNLVYEIGNEPTIHKTIRIEALLSVCAASGRLWASGRNDTDLPFYGTYLTAHTPRDPEWPRKAHDLLEYYHGGGPSAPTDPAHHLPCVGDEPIRPDDAERYTVLAVNDDIATDYRAHFATCALLGAGATFHSDCGKWCTLPTDLEARCAADGLRGLNAFPASAPTGPYRRIDEHGATSRTYVVGDSAVRIRPTTTTFPEPGWTALDAEGILWTRTSHRRRPHHERDPRTVAR